MAVNPPVPARQAKNEMAKLAADARARGVIDNQRRCPAEEVERQWPQVCRTVLSLSTRHLPEALSLLLSRADLRSASGARKLEGLYARIPGNKWANLPATEFGELFLQATSSDQSVATLLGLVVEHRWFESMYGLVQRGPATARRATELLSEVVVIAALEPVYDFPDLLEDHIAVLPAVVFAEVLHEIHERYDRFLRKRRLVSGDRLAAMQRNVAFLRSGRVP